MLLLPGCGPSRETYTALHSAWLTKERRERQADRVATGPPHGQVEANRREQAAARLRRALTRCAAERTPEPFVVRDQIGGRFRGHRVIDPSSGVMLQVVGRKVVVQTYALRTPQSVDRARGEAFAATAARTLAAARALIAQTLAKTGALPTTRSPTITDRSLAGGFAHMIPAYTIGPGGVVTALLEYLSDAPLSLRWTPSAARSPDGLPLSYACAADQVDATRWIPGCAFWPRFDDPHPELIYLEKMAPQLAAAAASDAAYQAARRGVTFGVRASNENQRLAWMACRASPATRVGGCDEQQGDTACIARLPRLCLIRDEASARDVGADLQNQWLAARIAASVPVRGVDIESRDAADARCAAQFGRGWRLARWSDNSEGFIASCHQTSGADVDRRAGQFIGHVLGTALIPASASAPAPRTRTRQHPPVREAREPWMTNLEMRQPSGQQRCTAAAVSNDPVLKQMRACGACS